jgi:acetolactate synthase-1/2/3 large subunit
MSEIHGGVLVAKTLKKEGVRYLFTLNGGHIGPILDACIDEGIRVIDTRHEEAAVHMAHGWSWATGEIGFATVTAGPGVTNAATGVANAWSSGNPIILLGGRPPLKQFGMGGFHEMDQIAFMRPITKWSESILETERIPEFITRAIRIAVTGRPGPVFLDIPGDVLRNRVQPENVWFPAHYRPEARVQGDPSAIEKAVKLLSEAQKPLLVAGQGVWRSQATQELREFVEASGIPVWLTHNGRGLIPAGHPLYFPAARSFALKNADVILVIGARFNYVLAYGRPPRFNEKAKVIQVDIDPQQIGYNRDVDVGIVGDARAVLKQFLQALEGKSLTSREAFTTWIEALREKDRAARQSLEATLNSPAVPIHPLRLCKEIRDFVNRDATLVVDGGDILSFARISLESYEPRHWLDAGTFGCLGQGLPFALAAKLARPHQQVLLLVGDGSFGFHAMEMDTAIRHNLSIVVVISNNASWAIEKYNQQVEFKRTIATDLRYSRYEEMVKALGGFGIYVEKPEELRPALEKAFSSGLPSCINVKTDPQAVSPDSRREIGTVPTDQTLRYEK